VTIGDKTDEYYNQFIIPNDVNFDEHFHADDESKIKEASEYQEELKQHYLNPQQAQGLTLPWLKASDFRIRAGETTIHSGYSGHRKSMMLGMIKLALIAQGEKCLSISLEMRPRVTLERMVKQFAGNGNMSVPLQEEFFAFAHNKLWLYDQIGTIKWTRVVGIARWAIENLGITQVVIDSLMKVGIKSKDHETQALFLDELTTLGKNTGAHIHLVAHSTKPQDGDETKPPGKYNTAGSADITNMVDNTIIHFQQKKEVRTYDQMMLVEKQRNPEGENAEPSFMLTFDEKSLQFKAEQYGSTLNPEDWRQKLWT
tara:strand:+ start:1116 stop:2054 length:939 start_codon:yes stop_codon:yes gene_type:complete